MSHFGEVRVTRDEHAAPGSREYVCRRKGRSGRGGTAWCARTRCNLALHVTCVSRRASPCCFPSDYRDACGTWAPGEPCSGAPREAAAWSRRGGAASDLDAATSPCARDKTVRPQEQEQTEQPLSLILRTALNITPAKRTNKKNTEAVPMLVLEVAPTSGNGSNAILLSNAQRSCL